jgi:putative transposase
MPNHVPLHKIVHSWKSYTANQINKVHSRSGAVWQREYFDRYMRDDDELRATIHYIEQNPVIAGLVECADAWMWSSARLRK